MAKLVDVAVIKVGELSPTIFSNGYPYHKVIMKGLKDSRTYTLNLQKKTGKSNTENYINWINNLKPGNTLRVCLQDNGKNVNQYSPFKILPNNLNTKSSSSTITSETIDEDIVFIQIERIKRATKIIQEAQEVINQTINGERR